MLARASHSGLNLGLDSGHRPKTCSNMFNLDSRKTPARGLINAMMQVLYIEGSDAAISIQYIEVEAQVATTYKG